MTHLISIFIIVFLDAALFAQAPDTLWTKTFGDRDSMDFGYSVQQTSDGGYIMAANTQSFGAGGYDVWLIRTDSNGDTLWTKTFGGSLNDRGNSAQQTTDGGYIIAGSTQSFGAGGYDVWLIKTGGNGDTLWTKTFGGSEHDEGSSIQQTIDGGYIISGATGSFGNGYLNVWLIKTNANGDSLWTRTFWKGDDSGGRSVRQTTDGGYVIAGWTEPVYGEGPDVWLIKTDGNGDTVWTKTFGGSEPDEGNSVQQTSDGGYIIAGDTQSFGAGGRDVWLIKTDSTGDALWTKTFGGSGNDVGYSVDTTSGGGYVIGAGGFGDVWLIKTDADGDSLWTRTIGRSYDDVGRFVQQTSDGGYIITGWTQFSGPQGELNVWLIKVTPDVTTALDGNPHAFINGYQLQQNYPNPFNPTTNIEFSIPKSEFVTLKVYSILGEEVTTLVSEKLAAGSYKYDWDASNLASGVYLYRIQAGDYVESKKMVLLR